MPSDNIIEQTTEFFLTKFKDKNVTLSNDQHRVLNQIITLAAVGGITLHLQHGNYINFIIDNICLLKSTLTDDDIISYSEVVWHSIDSNLKQETRAAAELYKREKAQFTNDNIPLHQDEDRKNLWLTSTHLQAVMPKDTKSFIVLTPVEVNALGAIDVRSHLNNPDVKSIVVPIGPGHWRLVQVEKTSSNGKPYLTVSIFDSFGESSGKTIRADVENWLKSQTTLPYTITYEAPVKKQNNGYECGDFVMAQAHTYAKRAGATYEPAFVDALSQGKSLRPLTIEKSKNPNAGLNLVIRTESNSQSNHKQPEKKWVDFFKKSGVTQQLEPESKSEASKTRDLLIEKGRQEAEKMLKKDPVEQEKVGQRVIDYGASQGNVIKVDEKTQIELDELFAKELQAQEEDYPRRGPR